MEVLALVLMPPAVAAAVGLGWWLAVRRDRWLDTVTRRRVLVHTRDGQTLDGQLARVDRDGLVLAPATWADGPHDLEGDTWVPRERVAWMQQPSNDPEGSS